MANFNMNKVILGGRLVADPELKQTQSGISVATFRMAVNRRYVSKENQQQGQQDVDFFTVTAWRTQADFVTRYFRKGSSICVVGSIQIRQWTDQQGQKRYSTDIVADEINFVDARGESGPADGGFNAPSFSTPDGTSNFEAIKTDDDLPF